MTQQGSSCSSPAGGWLAAPGGPHRLSLYRFSVHQLRLPGSGPAHSPRTDCSQALPSTARAAALSALSLPRRRPSQLPLLLRLLGLQRAQLLQVGGGAHRRQARRLRLSYSWCFLPLLLRFLLPQLVSCGRVWQRGLRCDRMRKSFRSCRQPGQGCNNFLRACNSNKFRRATKWNQAALHHARCTAGGSLSRHATLACQLFRVSHLGPAGPTRLPCTTRPARRRRHSGLRRAHLACPWAWPPHRYPVCALDAFCGWASGEGQAAVQDRRRGERRTRPGAAGPPCSCYQAPAPSLPMSKSSA